MMKVRILGFSGGFPTAMRPTSGYLLTYGAFQGHVTGED